MTQVEIESILQHEDIQGLLENAETTGSVRQPELADLIEVHQLDALETDALYNELDRRAAAVPARGRPPPAADGGPGGRAGEADRARRHGREDAHDPVEPASRRLDREELPQPGAALPRPDPGGHTRTDPCRREVRLAPWVQVLDVRDLVDPPGGRPRARGQGADDPHAGPHRRAAAEDEPRRAHTLDAARARTD